MLQRVQNISENFEPISVKFQENDPRIFPMQQFQIDNLCPIRSLVCLSLGTKNNHKFSNSDFYFLLSLTQVMVKKILFQGQIFEMEILMDLHFISSPESENNTFRIRSVCMCVCVSVCVSVCLCVCLCICYQHISKTNCSRNFKFGILLLYHAQMLIETFYKDRKKILCTGAHKRILIQCGLQTEFLVSKLLHI